MKQSDAGKAHCHTIFIAGFDYIIISDGAAGLGDVFHAASVCSLDIVSKREEGIGAECHIRQT